MDSRAFDPYAVLGVSPTASQAEITRAYRRQLRAHHPDTRTIDVPTSSIADEQLRQIVAAYGLLRDRGRRAAYDTAASPRSSVRSGAVRIPVRYGPLL